MKEFKKEDAVARGGAVLRKFIYSQDGRDSSMFISKGKDASGKEKVDSTEKRRGN